MTATSIIVTWARGDTRTAGATLIRQKYLCYYGVQPSVPRKFLVALLGGCVVATLAVEAVERARLPLTVLYDIPTGSLPKGDMVQWSRFTSAAPHARAAICYAAADHSLKIQRHLVLLEAKPVPVQRHAQDGVELRVTQGARLLAERAHRSIRPYYETPPPPVLYHADASHIREAYQRVIAENDVSIVIDL